MVTNGVTGLVVEPGSGAELTSAVAGLLAAPATRSSLGARAAAQAAQRFTHEARVAQFGRLIRAAAGRDEE
jgi:glycosyltransferase involved in cell wall biosynthesis